MLTRFAPTPSGFLHAGNAANALLVSWLAQQEGGHVALRIDDADAARQRPEYVTDIFDLLAWLGFGWNVGPRDAEDLRTSWSQSQRVAMYRNVLATAEGGGVPIYACTCSRSMLDGPPRGGCPAGCRQQHRPYVAGESVLRLHIPLGTTRTVDGIPIDVAGTVGDIVVWRRDDLPAYHLTSVVDDDRLGVTHIVRGIDLRPSTAVQQVLAEALGLHRVVGATVLHHDLLTGPDGAKLSKSQLGGAAPLPRTESTRTEVTEAAERLGSPLGITPPD